MPASFDVALKMVLAHEGGLQSDKSDSGNAGGFSTNRGITIRTLTAWRLAQGKRAPTDADIRSLSLAETSDIYRNLYWRPSGGDLLSDQAVATVLLDAAVVMGPAVVVKMAQQVTAGVSGQALLADGIMGPKTAAAINGCERRALLEPLAYRFQTFFLDCVVARKESAIWLPVWMRRASDWLSLIYQA